MKKVIYITFLDENKLSGYKHKIHSQCNAINNLGFETYLFIINNSQVYLYRIMKDSEKLIFAKERKTKRLFEKRNIIDELFLFNYFIKELNSVIDEINPDIVYIRRILPITPLLISEIKRIKDKKIKVYYEYPTFPWEKELLAEKKYLFYILDKIHFRRLEKIIDKIVIVGTNNNKLDDKYISISNAIKVDDIPVIQENNIYNSVFNMTGVANVNIFHGYDRVIKGLANYYSNNPKYIVKFHIVGGVNKSLKLEELVKQLNLQKHVIFHGYKNGKELEDIFNNTNIGIGCLGVHRKDISYLNSLKNREYTARGIPFVFSENDEAIEKHNPRFIYKPSFDDSPIDINKVLEFYEKLYITPIEIRNFAEQYLKWEFELSKVFCDDFE